MGQKDLTEKNLEFYPDVFADVVNALLYHGEQVVCAADLQAAPTEALYTGKDTMLRGFSLCESGLILGQDKVAGA